MFKNNLGKTIFGGIFGVFVGILMILVLIGYNNNSNQHQKLTTQISQTNAKLKLANMDIQQQLKTLKKSTNDSKVYRQNELAYFELTQKQNQITQKLNDLKFKNVNE